MRRYFFAVGFVLLVYAFWGQSATTLKIVGGLGPDFERVLMSQGLDYEYNGTILVVQADRKKDLVNVLARYLRDEQTRLDVIANNIANAGTTRGPEGVPYRRQLVRLGSDGFICGIVEDPSDFCWDYNPGHPDAMVEGHRAGYYPMPNVNLLQEQEALELHVKRVEAIEKSLKQIDPKLVIGVPGRSLPKPQPESGDLARPLSGLHGVHRANLLANAAHAKPSKGEDVLVQSNGVASGQACVAMAVKRLTGRCLTDRDIHRLYGFQLLKALKAESREAGYDWRDAGDISNDSWQFLEPILQEHLPVLLALNGPLDPSGEARGHIVLLESVSGDQVTYIDPWDGLRKTVSKSALESVPSHPDGNFLFVPRSLDEPHQPYDPFDPIPLNGML